MSKFTLKQKREIYNMWKSGKYYVKEILDKYYIYHYELKAIIKEFEEKR